MNNIGIFSHIYQVRPKLALILALISWELAPVASAQTYYVHGPGAASCGVWTSDRQRGGALAGVLEAWVEGFISAANDVLATPGSGVSDLASSTDDDGLFAWMDNYCAANPLKQVSSGADALVGELLKQKQQRH
jgi:hypothetical protein